MAAECKVRIYNRAGVLTHELLDVLSLAYERRVNAPGLLTFAVNGSHDLVGAVALDYQVEVWRRNQGEGLAWYCDFRGFVRDVERTATESGATRALLYCPGQMHLLRRAIVAYPAGTATRSTFGADRAETIAKALVAYNATSAGTTGDGRVRDVTLSGISVEADAETGPSMDYNCAWQNLLSALQDIAAVGAGDFDLVKTGAAAWEFRWYAGQLGTDRSATVTFSLAHGNMANPILRLNSLDERTVAVVGGQGEEALRAVAVRTGANYDATYNAVEMFVDARQMTTTGGLNTAGDSALAGAQARHGLEFAVIQTPGCLYGRDYFLGDLVTASFEEYTAIKKVSGITVEWGGDGERMSVETSDA